jgi:hypothetical protein
MGKQCPGVYLGHPVPGGYKYGDLALQVGGVSRIRTTKYGLESRETQMRAGLRRRGQAATVNYRSVFSSERALQNNKPKLSKRRSQGEKSWSRGPDGCLTPSRTGRLTVGRNLTSTSSKKLQFIPVYCYILTVIFKENNLSTHYKEASFPWLQLHFDRHLVLNKEISDVKEGH